MIYQEMPRKSYCGFRLDEDKGFFIEGKDYQDCLDQLIEWCAAHRDKWVYFHECGVGPAKPVPVARNVFEVAIYDAEPARPVLFFRCIQKGADGKREIDTMTDEEKAELQEKHMFFFYVLGSGFGH